jgi:hypothetical protein
MGNTIVLFFSLVYSATALLFHRFSMVPVLRMYTFLNDKQNKKIMYGV